MTTDASPHRRVAVTAMVAAGVLMAHQVAAKATRDAVFLSNYDPTALPAMVVGAAICAIAMGVLSSRLLSRLTPSRVVPWGFGLSAMLQLAEWRLLGTQPKLAAVLIYLHMVAFGAVLLSAFWSLTNELLDPHTAKQRFGQIAGAGTLGGVLGGLAAERISALFHTDAVLLWLAALHLIGAVALAAMRFMSGPDQRASHAPAPAGSARQAFSKAPYLFSLAALVLIGTASAAAVDWIFKAQAAARFARGEPLMRFFALFQTGLAVVTFLLQTLTTRPFLERFGLGRTVSSLPAAVTLGGVGALFFPEFPVMTCLRGTESVLRGSLFRSGYELFYTPIPVAEKRAAKSIIDVGMDRLGDAVGAGVTQVFLLLGPAAAANRILLTVVALSGAGVVLALRLDRGYIQALESSLLHRAVELDLSDVHDTTTRAALKTTPLPVAAPHAPAATTARPLEPVVQRMADLRSGRLARVRTALSLSDPLDPLLAGQVINLLGWDEVSDTAHGVLERAAPRICGQLIDNLLDASQDFAIRRRLPGVLAACEPRRAALGLMAGLADVRFEVRFQCGRALAVVLERNPDTKVDRETVLAVVERELSVSRSVWDGHRLLDRRDSSQQTQFLDEVLRERADASLEHVFTLLSLILPRDPLKVAFRALHTDDRLLRGLALEYLETVLPEHVREKLGRIVEQAPHTGERRTGDQVLASLMHSNQSVVMLLRERLRG